MATSKIHWTEKVFNPITGCTPASEGCAHCYAARMANRLRGRCGYPQDDPFRVTLHPDKLSEPRRWKKPCRIFVCSMGDLFHEDVPFVEIDRVFRVIAENPQHTFIVLTKRPERTAVYYAHAATYFQRRGFDSGQGWPLPNLWLGVTVENQERADERIPILLNTPAAVRFVSVEPMLEKVNLFGYAACMPGLDWVICGCESGPSARSFDLRWARMLRDQCVDSGTPFFFKQSPNPERPGKTISMPELDGHVWAQYPK